ncbi:unnamed protein product [Brassica oleracea]
MKPTNKACVCTQPLVKKIHSSNHLVLRLTDNLANSEEDNIGQSCGKFPFTMKTLHPKPFRESIIAGG